MKPPGEIHSLGNLCSGRPAFAVNRCTFSWRKLAIFIFINKGKERSETGLAHQGRL